MLFWGPIQVVKQLVIVTQPIPDLATVGLSICDQLPTLSTSHN